MTATITALLLLLTTGPQPPRHWHQSRCYDCGSYDYTCPADCPALAEATAPCAD